MPSKRAKLEQKIAEAEAKIIASLSKEASAKYTSYLRDAERLCKVLTKPVWIAQSKLSSQSIFNTIRMYLDKAQAILP